MTIINQWDLIVFHHNGRLFLGRVLNVRSQEIADVEVWLPSQFRFSTWTWPVLAADAEICTQARWYWFAPYIAYQRLQTAS